MNKIYKVLNGVTVYSNTVAGIDGTTTNYFYLDEKNSPVDFRCTTLSAKSNDNSSMLNEAVDSTIAEYVDAELLAELAL